VCGLFHFALSIKGRSNMPFTTDLRNFVHQHGAINNPFLDRFKRGELSDEEFRSFAVQFFAFVKHFPRILATLLANTPDDAAADDLTNILASELGDGDPKRRHEYLYHKFLRSIDIDPIEASRTPWLGSTRAYINGLTDLYGDHDYQIALGASYGLENMAISMWDQLIPGLMKLKETRRDFGGMNTVYWTFHRALESQHEAAMEHALGEVPVEAEASLRCGCEQALELLLNFWLGLDARRAA
jgi:pyrroloquinoline quinone (PQQ) biosynthesis protein C